MKEHFIIYVYILTDSNGEWWESLKKDGTTRRFAPGTAEFLRDHEFKTAELARQHGEKRGYERFRVVKLTPPVAPSITWGQEVVHDHDRRPKWEPGPNTDPESRPPIFAVSCKRTDKGAWKNLGGHWVKERHKPTEAEVQAMFRRQKTALTRAVKSGDHDRIIRTVNEHTEAWEASGWPFPDDWARWEGAKRDAEYAKRRAAAGIS